MLKKMIVKNFKCFKEETVFDFEKTNYKVLEHNSYGKILKGALFVGDNASGKTTAIQPIKLLLDLLLKDKEIPLLIYGCLFSTDGVTSMEYEFDMNGHAINYVFSFEGDGFVEERLTVDKKTVIERLKGSAKLEIGDDIAFHEVDHSILFLKQVYFNTKFFGNEVLTGWFHYLKNAVYIDAYTKRISTYNGENLAVKKYIEKQGVESLNLFLDEYNFKFSIRYEKKIEKNGIRYEMDENEGQMIFFERKGINVPIPVFMESAGNQTLISILPAIFYAVTNGSMLIIDEFSSGLHNKLEELLVKYVMRKGTTTQLFFVSHSTNLLSNTILRPDQIYTVEMEGDEGSRICRFSDEQPRAAQNLEKMYLSGVFGGIPEYGIAKE